MIKNLNWNKFGSLIFKAYLTFALFWVVFALFIDFFMVGIHFFKPELERQISNEIAWKIDGTFKNNPDNIWYEGPAK